MYRMAEVMLILVLILWGMILFDIGSISLRISQFFMYLETFKNQ